MLCIISNLLNKQKKLIFTEKMKARLPKRETDTRNEVTVSDREKNKFSASGRQRQSKTNQREKQFHTKN